LSTGSGGVLFARSFPLLSTVKELFAGVEDRSPWVTAVSTFQEKLLFTIITGGSATFGYSLLPDELFIFELLLFVESFFAKGTSGLGASMNDKILPLVSNT
jgi:hypothetical protein